MTKNSLQTCNFFSLSDWPAEFIFCVQSPCPSWHPQLEAILRLSPPPCPLPQPAIPVDFPCGWPVSNPMSPNLAHSLKLVLVDKSVRITWHKCPALGDLIIFSVDMTLWTKILGQNIITLFGQSDRICVCFICPPSSLYTLRCTESSRFYLHRIPFPCFYGYHSLNSCFR